MYIFTDSTPVRPELASLPDIAILQRDFEAQSRFLLLSLRESRQTHFAQLLLRIDYNGFFSQKLLALASLKGSLPTPIFLRKE